MSSWRKKFEACFTAAAFAEAGEHETAAELAGLERKEKKERVRLLQTINRTFAAAAFAEAGCHETAEEISGVRRRGPTFLEVVGLQGARVRYGLIPVAEHSFLRDVGMHGVAVRYLRVPL
ncbi:hypothetical protein ACFL2Q_05765 [Thermodesulfobacteriota bacterium]